METCSNPPYGSREICCFLPHPQRQRFPTTAGVAAPLSSTRDSALDEQGGRDRVRPRSGRENGRLTERPDGKVGRAAVAAVERRTVARNRAWEGGGEISGERRGPLLGVVAR